MIKKRIFKINGSLQVKNNTFYAVFRDKNGKQKWRTLGIPATEKNRRKAEAALHKLLVEYETNPNILDKIEVADYIQKWLDSVKNTLDTVTYEGYKQYAEKHIIPYFSQKKMLLRDVTISDIEGYYNAKAVNGRLDGKGGLSLRTIKLHGTVLSLVLKRAVYERLISDNPCEYAKYPTAIAKKKKEPTFYTVKQCNTLLDCIKGTPLYNMVYITFMYGLRRSELMGLKWDAVDFDNDTIEIKRTAVLAQSIVVRKAKTKNLTSKRTYPLLPEIKTILKKMLEEQEANRKLFGNCYTDTGHIFVKSDGTTYYPSYPTHRLTAVLEKYQLPYICWHGLRHSAASMLIERGWHMKDISDWLGHSDIGTTMNIYGHISMEHKKELGDSLTGLLA